MARSEFAADVPAAEGYWICPVCGGPQSEALRCCVECGGRSRAAMRRTGDHDLAGALGWFLACVVAVLLSAWVMLAFEALWTTG